MKRSPIAQFLRRITSSDETGYWRSLHRAKKLNLSTGVHGSKSLVSRDRVHQWSPEFDPWHCIASLFSALHTHAHTVKERLMITD